MSTRIKQGVLVVITTNAGNDELVAGLHKVQEALHVMGWRTTTFASRSAEPVGGPTLSAVVLVEHLNEANVMHVLRKVDAPPCMATILQM